MLRRWLSNLFAPRLDWIQVEVTSHCNAACGYCPRTVYRDTWLKRHLPLETFKKLLPAFPKTQLVYLQGWGEPFLNPDLFTMAALAKQAGCRVGVTTNGMLLDEEKTTRLLDLGFDVVAFSLAGTDEKNDAARNGTRLETVLDAIRALHRAKERRGLALPAIHIAYMLLRSGIESVEKLPRMLEGMGINQVVITTLDFVPSPEFEEEAIIPATPAEFSQLRSRLDLVAADGKRGGIDIHYQLRSPGERRLTCTENIQRAVFISSDGAVSPCTFTNLPVSDASFMAGAEEQPYQRLTFGNIHERPLAEIWREKAYARFRNSFYTEQLAVPCQQCPKLHIG